MKQQILQGDLTNVSAKKLNFVLQVKSQLAVREFELELKSKELQAKEQTLEVVREEVSSSIQFLFGSLTPEIDRYYCLKFVHRITIFIVHVCFRFEKLTKLANLAVFQLHIDRNKILGGFSNAN